MLPVPTGEDKILVGREISARQLEFIVPHSSTRSEVLARLGQPGLIWNYAKIDVYAWDMRQGVLLWAAGAFYKGGAGLSDIPKHYFVFIQYDAEDRVLRVERTTRPLLEDFSGFLQRWAGHTPVPAKVKPKVLIRIRCRVDGRYYPPFSYSEAGVLVGWGSFESAGEPQDVRPLEFSDATYLAGWFYLETEPGVHYLSVVGPESNVYGYRGIGGVDKVLRAAPRWRIDVPDGDAMIYAGTLELTGRNVGELMFGGIIVAEDPSADISLSNEEDAARELLASQKLDPARLKTVLMSRWYPGEPIVIGSVPARSKP